MTDKLYYKDSHLHEFDATVLDYREDKNGSAVILDKTAFFPGGGGQLADTGYIGKARVLNVKEINGEILHYVDIPIGIGSVVHCSLDWEKRYRRMQEHSAEHVVSGIVHKIYGYDNVGFHMGDNYTTEDFNGNLTLEDLVKVETLANEAVRDDIEVVAYFPSKEELSKLSYRSKLSLTSGVRIVKSEGIDCCACCAPHVKHTGEIGLIKILNMERHKDFTRIMMTAGMDALDHYRIIQNDNDEIARLLSTKVGEAKEGVKHLLCEKSDLREKILELEKLLVDFYVGSLKDKKVNICFFNNTLSDDSVRDMINILVKKVSGIVAVFSGNDGNYKYIIGSNSVNLKSKLSYINLNIEGRGGGSSLMIQGMCKKSHDDIKSFIDNFSI